MTRVVFVIMNDGSEVLKETTKGFILAWERSWFILLVTMMIFVFVYLLNDIQLTYRWRLVVFCGLLASNTNDVFANLTNGSKVKKEILKGVANGVIMKIYIVSFYDDIFLCLSPQQYTTDLNVEFFLIIRLLSFKITYFLSIWPMVQDLWREH